MDTFGDRLHKLRRQKGLSLDGLAAAAGISTGYLWKLERQPDANPSIDIAQKLSVALGTTVGTLVPPGPDSDAPKQEIPESLKQAKSQFGMSTEEVQDLAGIRFHGGHPITANEWGLLYLLLSQILKGKVWVDQFQAHPGGKSWQPNREPNDSIKDKGGNSWA